MTHLTIKAEKLDTLDDQKRAESLEETVNALEIVLLNRAGLKRLRQISDQKWDEAERKDSVS